MKAVTIWQPWASLMAHGFKKFETRSWDAPKNLIGQRIAIHSAKRLEFNQRLAMQDRQFAAFYKKTGLSPLPELPFGHVLATGILKDCLKMTTDFIEDQSMMEFVFGWWEPDRFAWHFTEVEVLAQPIEAKGMQGIWNWHEPSSLTYRKGKHDRTVASDSGVSAV